jgi:hypothetical protein
VNDLQRLIDIQALQELKGRYFFYLDTKDWTRWLELFTEEATLVVDAAPSTLGRDPQTMPKVSGREAIRDFVVARLDRTPTVHHGHTPLFEFQSASEATGIWAMEDIVEFTGGTVHGHGHYRERYRKVHGEWRFASVHLTRLRLAIADARLPEAARTE